MKKYDQVMNSSLRLMTIQEIWISKCLYYYRFKEIMDISPNVGLPYIAELGHPDCITLNKALKNIDGQKYKLFLQSSQDKVTNLENLPIDPSLLSCAQKNSVFFRINPDDLNKSQTSLAKNILLGDRSTTKKKM